MGLLKKIFGKPNKETDEQFEKELEQIKSGEINKVYPILKPGDWIGVKSGCVKQTLLGTPENPQLVLGFGYDAPANFVFIRHADLERKAPEAIIKKEFEVSSTANGKILTASGKDFSSEKILCKNHMLKAHQLLNSNELLVSIPRRRCMMVVSRQSGRELIGTFVTLHKNAWEDDSYGNAPIINAIFVVKDGEVEGIIPVEK